MTTLVELKKEKEEKSLAYGVLMVRWKAGNRKDSSMLKQLQQLTEEILDLGLTIKRMETAKCQNTANS